MHIFKNRTLSNTAAGEVPTGAGAAPVPVAAVAAAPVVAVAAPVAPVAVAAPAPVAVAAPVAAPVAAVAPPPVVAAPAPVASKTLHELLNEPGPDEAQKRLARAARKALKEFGIDIEKDCDIAAEAARYKSDRQAKKAERDSLRETADKATSYKLALDAYAKTELASISDDARSFVLSVAPSDVVAQLAHIAALRTAGRAGVPSAVVPVVPVAGDPAALPVAGAPLAALPLPAQSAPAQPGPAVVPVGAVDHYAEWKRIREDKSPRVSATASLYFLQHSFEIESAMARSAS